MNKYNNISDKLINILCYIIKTPLYTLNYVYTEDYINYKIKNDIYIDSLNPIEFVIYTYYHNLIYYIYNKIPEFKEYIPKIKIICDSYLKQGINNGRSYLYKYEDISDHSIDELFDIKYELTKIYDKVPIFDDFIFVDTTDKRLLMKFENEKYIEYNIYYEEYVVINDPYN